MPAYPVIQNENYDFIVIEANLKPAKVFYRNLMTEQNMKTYGDELLQMFKNEGQYYNKTLLDSIQNAFDFTNLVKSLDNPVYAIYGNRGYKSYPNRIEDLCLDDETIFNMKFYFVEESCHMPMIENPLALTKIIQQLIEQ